MKKKQSMVCCRWYSSSHKHFEIRMVSLVEKIGIHFLQIFTILNRTDFSNYFLYYYISFHSDEIFIPRKIRLSVCDV